MNHTNISSVNTVDLSVTQYTTIANICLNFVTALIVIGIKLYENRYGTKAINTVSSSVQQLTQLATEPYGNESVNNNIIPIDSQRGIKITSKV